VALSITQLGVELAQIGIFQTCSISADTITGADLGMKIIQTVHVNGYLCTGHKLCLSEAPEIFAFDDCKGVAFVKDGASLHYAANAEDIYTAAAACPMDAILINGEVPIRAK